MGLRQADVSMEGWGWRPLVNLYRGQVYAALAVFFLAFGIAAIYTFTTIRDHSDPSTLIVLIVGMIAVITGAVIGALAYVSWLPKWERDEKRSGKGPGQNKENR